MKTTKKRLQELAAINNPFVEPKKETIKEVDAKVIPSAAGGDIQMTVTFENAIQYFEDSAETMGLTPDYQMPDFQQKLANLMQEDLEDWLGQNGAQWLEDGIDADIYTDLENK